MIFSTGKYSNEYTHLLYLYYIGTYTITDYYNIIHNTTLLLLFLLKTQPPTDNGDNRFDTSRGSLNGMLALKSPGDTLLLCNACNT